MGRGVQYERWVDLAAGVLEQPIGADSLGTVCEVLGEHFRAPVVGTVECSPSRAWLSGRGPACRQPIDLDFYSTHALDVPVLQHYRRTGDTHVRASQEVDACARDSRALAVMDRLRADQIHESLVFPLPPARGRWQRWLALARPEPFGTGELELAAHVHRLIVGLERHALVIAGGGPALALTGRPAAGTGPLTAREQAVLVLMAEGLIARAIAHRLGVSPRTVAKHQERIYRKLGTSDRLTTVLWARDAGLVRVPSRL